MNWFDRLPVALFIGSVFMVVVGYGWELLFPEERDHDA